MDYKTTVSQKRMPWIDDTLDTLAGSYWFFTLDLVSGYWQVEMSQQDREKTAFCVPDGLFEFKVMLFRHSNAPVTFQSVAGRFEMEYLFSVFR